MDLYQQEIDELTDLMRNDWQELRECILNLGLEPNETLVAAFVEDEEEMEYCILVTKDQKILDCCRSTVKGEKPEFDSVKELPKTDRTFKLSPTLELALVRQANA